ncbi:gastrula zinc finger protein XlCGF57.1-like [Pelmatolapia mariae]|uniref:gastrula zinc finger protein XlCGF57.1-like n=1 Tax=Pelmatolapia mariae TaxID=158779 RepID=UPI002FE5E8A0
MSLQFISKNRTNAGTMNEEEYCQQHDTESVRFKDNPGSKPLGVHQQLDVKQTDDISQLLAIKEVPPEWSPTSDPQDPEVIQIKEEQEELWTSQVGEQLNGVQLADISRFPGHAVSVKHEDSDEKSEYSQCSQRKTKCNREAEALTAPPAKGIKMETDGDDCGGPESARSPYQDIYIHPNGDEKASSLSETEVSINDDDDDYYWQEPLSDSGPDTEDSDSDWKETRTPELGVNSDKGQDSSKVSECNKTFLCKQSLQGERGRMSSSGLAKKKCFTVSQNDDSSVAVRTGEKPFGCDVCGQRFNQKTHLNTHIRIHTGEKPFCCDFCGQRFNQKTHLKIHMRIHTGEKPFGCDNCGKRFRHQCTLKIHMAAHTGEKPFTCDDCGKRFSHQKILKAHMTIHTGEKPFHCDECGKSFSQQGILKAHMTVHTGEKPFGCSRCDKKFRLHSDLTAHMRVHTGEKPFGCDKCGKRFSQKGCLQRHLRLHTGEKPFSCDDCGKQFKRKTHLKAHMTVHTGDKPFGCDVCGVTFSRQGTLKRHMRVHTR